MMKKIRYFTNSPEMIRRVIPTSQINTSQSSVFVDLQSPIELEISPTEASSTLLKKHYFVKYRPDGSRSVRKVFFTENLLKLVIQKDDKKASSIPTCDILRIDLGFSKQLLSSIIRSEYVYGFQVVLDRKTVEMSCTSREEREKWVLSVNKLLDTVKQWHSLNGLRLFWDSLNSKPQNLAVQRQESISVASSLASSFKESQQKLIFENQRLVSHFCKKRDEIKKMKSSCTQKEEEIKNLKEKLTAAELQIVTYCKSFEYSNLEELSRIWLKVLEFFTMQDLISLRLVSQFYKELVLKFLSIKTNWKLLLLGGLAPRDLSWNFFCDRFFSVQPLSFQPEISEEVLLSIYKDVNRGLPDLQEEVVSLLTSFCSINKEIGYCQGMQQVAHFILRKFKTQEKALSVMLTLMRPPYFLGEMWKNEMTRFKIGVFQLKSLVKVKLPMLAKHLKQIDLNLDVFISSWLLTLFIHLNSQQAFPIEQIEVIWDFFLVQGWPALISACLALLDMTKHRVIGESFEHTVQIFTSQLPHNGLNKAIKKFEVDWGLLDDLERAYYLQ